MFIKVTIIVLVLCILFCLIDAAVLLTKRKRPKEAMVKALTWRISLSVLLFLILLLSFGMGWLKPHAV